MNATEAAVTHPTPIHDALTGSVLDEVWFERGRQDARWGEQNHPDGTGGVDATTTADLLRSVCDQAAATGTCTWARVLAEEVGEAFAETGPDRLRAEVIQAAAVLVAWAECIDRRPPGR